MEATETNDKKAKKRKIDTANEGHKINKGTKWRAQWHLQVQRQVQVQV